MKKLALKKETRHRELEQLKVFSYQHERELKIKNLEIAKVEDQTKEFISTQQELEHEAIILTNQQLKNELETIREKQTRNSFRHNKNLNMKQ